MKLIDANLLLYAYDLDSPFHAPAKTWLEETLEGPEPVDFLRFRDLRVESPLER